MENSRRLDAPPSVAGMYLRVICTHCGGQGCRLCNEGYTWVSTYAQGRGEQGDDLVDLRGYVRIDFVFDGPDCENFHKARAADPLGEAGHQ